MFGSQVIITLRSLKWTWPQNGSSHLRHGFPLSTSFPPAALGQEMFAWHGGCYLHIWNHLSCSGDKDYCFYNLSLSFVQPDVLVPCNLPTLLYRTWQREICGGLAFTTNKCIYPEPNLKESLWSKEKVPMFWLLLCSFYQGIIDKRLQHGSWNGMIRRCSSKLNSGCTVTYSLSLAIMLWSEAVISLIPVILEQPFHMLTVVTKFVKEVMKTNQQISHQ